MLQDQRPGCHQSSAFVELWNGIYRTSVWYADHLQLISRASIYTALAENPGAYMRRKMFTSAMRSICIRHAALMRLTKKGSALPYLILPPVIDATLHRPALLVRGSPL